MAIAVPSASTALFATATTCVITKPSGLAAGDLMVATICNNGTDTVSLSGWTQIATNQQASALRMTSLYKVASSGDAAATNFTFTLTGSQLNKGSIMRITGMALNVIIDSFDSDSNTNVANVLFAGGVTPSHAGSVLIFPGYFNTAGGSGLAGAPALVTDDISWTVEGAENTGGNTKKYMVGYGIRSAVTATGNYSCSNSSGDVNDDAVGQLIVVNPASGVTVSADLLSIASSTQAPTEKGGATVTVGAPVSMASSVVTPEYANQARWSPKDRSSGPTLTPSTRSSAPTLTPSTKSSAVTLNPQTKT